MSGKKYVGQVLAVGTPLTIMECSILSDTEAECVVISEQTNWDSSKDTCPRYIHPYDKVNITLNPEGFSKEIIELGNIPDGCKI